jgi:hypothetical protein
MKTYKKTKIGYNFPEAGTKAWIKAIEQACKHPGFKLKASKKDLGKILEDNEDLTATQKTNLITANLLIRHLANN